MQDGVGSSAGGNRPRAGVARPLPWVKSAGRFAAATSAKCRWGFRVWSLGIRVGSFRYDVALRGVRNGLHCSVLFLAMATLTKHLTNASSCCSHPPSTSVWIEMRKSHIIAVVARLLLGKLE